MRIAPKPKSGQEVQLEELLSTPGQRDPEKPIPFSGLTLPDGRAIPGEQVFIQDNGAFYTLGTIQVCGRAYVIDVAKTSGGQRAGRAQNTIPGPLFSMANGLEFYQILHTALFARDYHNKNPLVINEFIRNIAALWDEADLLEINTQVKLIDANRAMAAHKTPRCPDFEICGRSHGPSDESLGHPCDSFISICEMLFGIPDQSKVNNLWKEYTGQVPKVYQTSEWPPRLPMTEFYPLLGTDQIIHGPYRDPARGYLQVRRYRLQP